MGIRRKCGKQNHIVLDWKRLSSHRLNLFLYGLMDNFATKFVFLWDGFPVVSSWLNWFWFSIHWNLFSTNWIYSVTGWEGKEKERVIKEGWLRVTTSFNSEWILLCGASKVNLFPIETRNSDSFKFYCKKSCMRLNRFRSNFVSVFKLRTVYWIAKGIVVLLSTSISQLCRLCFLIIKKHKN